LHRYDKTPDTKALGEEGFIFAHDFKELSPQSMAPLILGVVRQNIRRRRYSPMVDRK
jgi:hypothetical protein